MLSSSWSRENSLISQRTGTPTLVAVHVFRFFFLAVLLQATCVATPLAYRHVRSPVLSLFSVCMCDPVPLSTQPGRSWDGRREEAGEGRGGGGRRGRALLRTGAFFARAGRVCLSVCFRKMYFFVTWAAAPGNAIVFSLCGKNRKDVTSFFPILCPLHLGFLPKKVI